MPSQTPAPPAPPPDVAPLDYAPPPPARPVWRHLAVGPASGLAAIGLLGLLALLLLPSLNTPHRNEPAARCANNLRQIALACLMYAGEHGGRFPPTVNDVLLHEEITPDVFVCPSGRDTPAAGPSTQAVAANLTTGGHLSYAYVGGGMTTSDPSPSTTILAYEIAANHSREGAGAGINVVYADAHVERQDATTIRKMVAELQAGHNPPRPEKLR